MTKEQARSTVEVKLRTFTKGLTPGDEMIILDESTLERPWGWIFFYTSKKYHETKNVSYAIAGNAPFIVEKESGRLLATGTAQPIEHYINNYERTGNPAG